MKEQRNWLFLALAVLLAQVVSGQELSKYLGSYNNTNASGYLQPLVDLSASALNTGQWSSSPLDSGFHLRVGLSFSAAMPFDAQRSFTGSTEAPFTPEQTADVPTIIGDVENVTVSGVNGTAYVFPGGFNAKYFPIAVLRSALAPFMAPTFKPASWLLTLEMILDHSLSGAWASSTN